ncbi:unnamed protein product [Mytilus coruscus]|uniref:Ig-like domain-containing protein n=1 Tax=Mytilus coruscus TaxID=42192 RepID=A0A6J8ARJ9_MYTCO|nr:unnamed protein product [Mytilus coruscus]
MKEFIVRISERLKIISKKGGRDYGLQISNVTMFDSGLYRCAVDTISNLTYYFVTLEVKAIPIVPIFSIPSIIVVILALIAAIRLCQIRHMNKVSCSQVNNQQADIDEIQQSEHFYDKVDYDAMFCEVQNNSHITRSSYHYHDTRNIESMFVNRDNPLTGTSQKIDRNSQANVSEQTYDYSYVSNLYQLFTEHWGSDSRTYVQCPPCQTVSGYHNIADSSQIGNMYQHLLTQRKDAKHIYY